MSKKNKAEYDQKTKLTKQKKVNKEKFVKVKSNESNKYSEPKK